MKITARMFLMFAVSLVGMIVLFCLSLGTIEKVKVNGPIYREIAQSKDLAADILPPPEYIIESYLVVQLAQDAADARELQKLQEDFTRLKKEFDERHQFWDKELKDPATRKLMLQDAYAPAAAFYTDAQASFFPALARGDRQASAAVLANSLKPNYASHRLQVDRLVQLVDRQCKQAEQTAKESLTNSYIAIFLAGALITLLTAALSFFITRSITVPLSRCVAIADHLATGDLTDDIEIHSQDETGHLMAAMRNMVQNLRGLVQGTVEISGNIAAASVQLTATARHIAAGAQEVAGQTDQVATASEEMSHTSRDIAQNCSLAAESSRHSSATATEGAAVVRETIEGMARIADRVKQTAQVVDNLGSRSDQIGAIIGTIEDIADQTNLLALNAAIEAARAGEQGRGFAVVADEVRALAERTTRATQEIGTMIKAIQRETKEAVGSMEDGVQQVEQGAQASRRSGEALQSILSQIDHVTEQINQIATAAEEQTATTGEITSNVQQVSAVVQDSARGAQETSAAAGQLAQQAQQLQGLVAAFKLP
jgi:methyl-accepting chemotaxis protein